MEKMIFKAWHKERKQMYWFDLFWGNHGHGDGYIGMVELGLPRETDNRHNGNQVNIDPHDCEILRPTGLKDKNGNEIYEGDILWYEARERYFRVFSVPGGFAVNTHQSDINKDKILFYMDLSDMQNSSWVNGLKIKGNIYENPELLNN